MKFFVYLVQELKLYCCTI